MPTESVVHCDPASCSVPVVEVSGHQVADCPSSSTQPTAALQQQPAELTRPTKRRKKTVSFADGQQPSQQSAVPDGPGTTVLSSLSRHEQQLPALPVIVASPQQKKLQSLMGQLLTLMPGRLCAPVDGASNAPELLHYHAALGPRLHSKQRLAQQVREQLTSTALTKAKTKELKSQLRFAEFVAEKVKKTLSLECTVMQYFPTENGDQLIALLGQDCRAKLKLVEAAASMFKQHQLDLVAPRAVSLCETGGLQRMKQRLVDLLKELELPVLRGTTVCGKPINSVVEKRTIPQMLTLLLCLICVIPHELDSSDCPQRELQV